MESLVNIKDHKTGRLFDPWGHLGPKRRKLLDESWAGLFRKEILPDLPVDKMAPFFDAGLGRPTKELYTVQGVLILQQMHDLSDEETVQQLAFSLQWHYALDIASDSDNAAYICPKTLWNMRQVVTDHGLDTVLFNHTTDKLAKVFKVDTAKPRLDSVHIKSNMRRLGRLGILVRTIHKFLINLKRHHAELFATIEPDLVDRYFTEKSLGCFSLVKPSNSQRTLAAVGADLGRLAQLFQDHPEIAAMHSYQLLARVLHEQCTVKAGPAGDPPEISLKAPREIAADSLQNPADPDAGYDGHKGQGYQVQVMETYCVAEDEKIRSQTLNLITQVEVQPAHESDAHALIPALKSTQERGLGPEEVLADALYGGDDNCQAAAALGVELVSPTMGKAPAHAVSLADFTFSENHRIVACPQGQVPVKVTSKKKRYCAAFNSELCLNCSIRDGCPVKPGKKAHYLHYDDKTLRLARRRAQEPTPAFKERYRYRSGIEGAMPEYATRTGVKRLRVRGKPAVGFCARLKAIGVNIYRATAVRQALTRANRASEGGKPALAALFLFFKEQFAALGRLGKDSFAPDSYRYQNELKMAA